MLATEKGEGLANDKASSSKSLSNMSGDKAKDLPSFWVPAMTPDTKPVFIPKPDTNIYCPVSGKLLKIKDLTDVKFTLAPNDDERGKSLISRQVRYMCPVTRGKHFTCFLQCVMRIHVYGIFLKKDILSNSVPCTVLKTT